MSERSDPILLATDLGPGSPVPTARAIDLATATRRPLVILHVLDLGGLPAAARDVADPVRESAALRLDAVVKKARERGLKVHGEVREGRAPREIARAAKRWNAGLLVLGPHQGTTLGDLVVGTTIRRVLQRVNCPVLVPQGSPPLLYATALALTDFSEPCVAAFYAALPFLAKGAEIQILHTFGVADYPVALPELGLGVEAIAALERVAARKVQDFVAGIRVEGYRLRPRVEVGPTAAVVRAIVHADELPLVIVGSRGQGRVAATVLGSTAERVLRTAGCDVMVVPSR